MSTTKSFLAAIAMAATSTIALLANHGNAKAADVYRLSTSETNIIVINGNLDYDTPKKVRFALAKFNNTAGIVINSPGGSTLVALQLQKMIVSIKDSKVTVPAYGTCASACVDVLMAASTIQAHTTSRIGVHLGINKATGRAATDEYANRLYRIRGVPETVIWKMNSTPPSKVSWFTNDEFLSIPGTRLFHETTYTVGYFINLAQYRVDLD